MQRVEIQVHERLPFWESLPLSFQHLFAMFGSTVLVPVIFGVDPATILLMNGIGTLLYILITKGKIPAYLGSSFAFISPVTIVLERFGGIEGYGYALGGFLAVGLVLTLTGWLISKVGTKWLDIIFPPAAMGAIVAVIGLELVPVAARMAGLISDGSPDWKMDPKVVTVSLLTLAITIICWVTLRGFLGIIPILIGIVAGYIIAFAFGLVNMEQVEQAKFFAFPTFYSIKFDLSAILTILPAALVLIPEHIGHLVVTGNIVKKDLVKDPGLHRSLMGNGVSTILSSLFGSTRTPHTGKISASWVSPGCTLFG